MKAQCCDTCKKQTSDLLPVFCHDGSNQLRRNLMCLGCIRACRTVGYGELLAVLQ